jgi:putative copper export protein
LSYYQKRAILPYVLFLVTVAMFVGRMEPNEEVLYRILHRCLLPSLAPFGHAVSEEKIFLTLANQKQELPLAAIFVGGMGRNEETL